MFFKNVFLKKLNKENNNSLKLIKSTGNPIIAPNGENGWEAWQTFNPGAILLENSVHFIYRAIGGDGVSRLGYAMSEDGFEISEKSSSPVYEQKFKDRICRPFSYFSGGSWMGCEDPRIVRVEDEDVLYVTYTSVGDGGIRMALTSIKINDFLEKRWNWQSPVFMSPPGKVHKNWVIFPEKINGRYAVLHSLNPEVSIEYLDDLNFDNDNYIESFYGREVREDRWDSLTRGPGAPPIKTKHGWLLFYHAIENKDPDKYKAGAMLLDLEDPTKVLFRAKEPVLEPTEIYENNGYKSGVVYISGVVNKNGELLVYYGGADSNVCVASANLEEFLEAFKKEEKPKLVSRLLKKRKKKNVN